MSPEYRSPTQVRITLTKLIAEQGDKPSTLSRVIGRSPSYLSRFLNRGTPQRLQRDDAERLSRYLGVHQRELGNLPAAELR